MPSNRMADTTMAGKNNRNGVSAVVPKSAYRNAHARPTIAAVASHRVPRGQARVRADTPGKGRVGMIDITTKPRDGSALIACPEQRHAWSACHRQMDCQAVELMCRSAETIRRSRDLL